jgi:hypothetical protein
MTVQRDPRADDDDRWFTPPDAAEAFGLPLDEMLGAIESGALRSGRQAWGDRQLLVLGRDVRGWIDGTPQWGPSPQALLNAGHTLAIGRLAAEQMSPREQAEAAYTPTGPPVDELEDRIRARRGLPPIYREGRFDD